MLADCLRASAREEDFYGMVRVGHVPVSFCGCASVLRQVARRNNPDYNVHVSTVSRERLRALRAVAALCAALSACAAASPPTATRTPQPKAVLRDLPPTTAATPLLTRSFVAPTPAPIGPTATPHTYRISSGDTLIAIAAEHGVTVEALQLVNAGIDPLALQVGHDLIIPFAGADATTGYLPSPTPLPLNLTAFRCYPTPAGGQLCLGEARNDSGQAVINLAVQVTVVLPDGELGPSQVTFAPVEIVLPGESAPLAARFEDLGAVWGAAARVVAARDGSALVERFLTVTIGATAGEVSASDHYTVSAVIMNESAQHANAIAVLISGYNAEDELRTFRIVDLDQGLPAGTSGEIVATFTVPAEEISRFAVSAHARAGSP